MLRVAVFEATVLGVDAANQTGATELYQRAGMRVIEHFTRWEFAGPGRERRQAD